MKRPPRADVSRETMGRTSNAQHRTPGVILNVRRVSLRRWTFDVGCSMFVGIGLDAAMNEELREPAAPFARLVGCGKLLAKRTDSPMTTFFSSPRLWFRSPEM